jgi:hypothetical protein
MDVAILFAPVGALIPEALSHTAKGGTVMGAPDIKIGTTAKVGGKK